MSFIELSEKLRRVKVFRQGKKKILKKSDREGYRTSGNKEVKMSAAEKLKRKKAQRIGALKRKKSKNIANVRRAKSIRRRG